MFFEAKVQGVSYSVVVRETKEDWAIELKEADKDWVTYKLPKASYKTLDSTVSLLFKKSSYLVDVVGDGTDYTVYTRGSYRDVHIFNDEMLLHESLKTKGALGGHAQKLEAGMPGKITRLLVKKGELVEKDQPLLIMEAMKMENELKALHGCKIQNILVDVGDNVETGATLITFAEKEQEE